jgi:hypothetical protein
MLVTYISLHDLNIRVERRPRSGSFMQETAHNISSTAPQLSFSLKALGTLSEDVNVMPKHVGVTIRN